MPAAPGAVLPHLADVQNIVLTAVIDTGTWVGAGEQVPVEVLSGSVSDDRSQQWRRSVTATLHPDTDPALLEPWGHRLILRQGLVLPDGSQATAGLGVFRLQTRARPNGAGWAISGRSLEAAVIDDVYDAPTTLSSESAVALVTAIIVESVPGARVVVDRRVVDARVPAVVHEERWGAIVGKESSIATALGADVFCDGDGVFRIVPVPTLADLPVETIAPGGALTDFSEDVSRDGIPNRVVAYGDRLGTDAPQSFGVWEDTLPGSKTRRGGPFGRVTLRFPNPVLTSDAQAENAARTRGLGLQGLRSSVSFAASHNPWRSAGDVVSVVDPDGRARSFILDSLTTPLGGGVQTASARAGM